MEFEFEKWAELAKNDPDEFERQRTSEILSLIEQMPEHLQKNMRKQMKRIAIIRATNKDNPLLSAAIMCKEMIHKVIDLGNELEKLGSKNPDLDSQE